MINIYTYTNMDTYKGQILSFSFYIDTDRKRAKDKENSDTRR